MKKIIIFSIFSLGLYTAQAQEDSTQEVKKNTLTLGVTYTNNASYYGQKPEEKTPYVAGVASYKLKSGIYFSGSAYRLLNDSAKFASASSLGIGYGFGIGKKLSADISYSHTFYPAYSPFLQAANNNTASASLNYQYFLNSGIAVDYAFGKQNDVFTTFSTNKDIVLGHLFNQKDGISITPGVEIVAGTQRFYETYVEEKRVRDSILGLPIPPLLGGGGGTTTTTTTKVSTDFNLLSYNFKLPLSYYRSSYLLELSYQLSLLSKEAESGAGTTNSFVNLSFYYQF